MYLMQHNSTFSVMFSASVIVSVEINKKEYIQTISLPIKLCMQMCIFIQPFRHEQELTQGQFFSRLRLT